MIQRLEVKGLNNRLDGKFEFNEDLNIFTGANGSGKTTLLKLIWYLTSGNLERIYPEIPFDSVSIVTDLFSLTISRLNSGNIKFFSGKNSLSKIVDITVTVDQKTGYPDRRDYIEELHELNVYIASAMKNSLFFPTFRRIEGGFSIDRNAVHTEGEAVVRLLSSTAERLLTAIAQLSDDISTEGHEFISTVSTMDIVKFLPQKYGDIYQEISNRQSQILANISREIQSNPDKDEVGEIPKSASALLDTIRKVEEETEQLKKPISVLSELSRKILRYNTILVTEKLVLGEKTDGLVFGEGSDDIAIEEINNAISSDKLSSGEKQMLSFLCYNAFYKDTAIFIDEPELSLHVDWQSLLLPTLLEQSTSNQFFVATHSPFIYTLYPDKEFMLSDTRGYQGEV